MWRPYLHGSDPVLECSCHGIHHLRARPDNRRRQPRITHRVGTYPFTDVAKYTILPSGALIVDKDGDGSCWVLTPDRWQWLRSTNHSPGVEGTAGGGQFGSVF